MSDAIGVNLSSSRDIDKDQLFVCPYDPVHRISSKRFVYHIHKCKKQHPHLETETCPFNARHIVLKPEIRHHISICPDKRLIELELNQLDILELPNAQSSVPNEAYDFQNGEDWDKEDEEEDVRVAHPTQNGFCAGVGGKRVNARREAIKKMKREYQLKKESEEADDYKMRRPFLNSLDILNQRKIPTLTSPYSHTASVAPPSERMNVERTENVSSVPTSARSKARLAANFNPQQNVVPAIGRGRHMREINMNGVGSCSTSSRTVAVVDMLCNQSPNMYGFGRGRFATEPGVTSSNLNSFHAAGSNAMLNDEPKAVITNGSIEPGSEIDWGNDDLRKRERKTLKLLKQIETLEKKFSSGIKLDKEQNEKLERKPQIQVELQEIREALRNES